LKLFSGVTIAGLLMAVTGCGAVQNVRDAAERSTRMNDLKQFWLAYDAFEKSNNRPPKDAPELKSKSAADALPKNVDSFTVAWGASLKEPGNATKVFAWVLIKDGKYAVINGDYNAQVITKAELDKAPKMQGLK
jgi:hypothetical protein